MAPTAAASQAAYAKDEKALCFHGEMLYEAKVLEVRRQDARDKTSPYEYRVHYKGWKNTWDDWVPQDRLRKNNEDNRELAANLRRELTQSAQPKSTVKPSSKRGKGGSDFGSGRGSEERHSSVPAGGRGTKRGKDNDIEKVGPISYFSPQAIAHRRDLLYSPSLDPLPARHQSLDEIPPRQAEASTPDPGTPSRPRSQRRITSFFLALPTEDSEAGTQSQSKGIQDFLEPDAWREHSQTSHLARVSVPALEVSTSNLGRFSNTSQLSSLSSSPNSTSYSSSISLDTMRERRQAAIEANRKVQIPRSRKAQAKQSRDHEQDEEDDEQSSDEMRKRIVSKISRKAINNRDPPSGVLSAKDFDVQSSGNPDETTFDILSHPPSADPLEYISNATANRTPQLFWAPLLSGTTYAEQVLIRQELEDAGKIARAQIPPKHHPGFTKTKEIDPTNISKLLFYESVNPLQKVMIAGVPKDPLDIDPPGSGGPFDALKFPQRLLEKLDRLPGIHRDTLEGWDNTALKKIPLTLTEQLKPMTLALLPSEITSRLPQRIIDTIPELAPFNLDEISSENEDHEESGTVDEGDAGYEGEDLVDSEIFDDIGGGRVRQKHNPATRYLAEGLMIPHNVEKCRNCIEFGIKCNGRKPKCYSCIKFDEACSFAEALLALDSITTTEPIIDRLRIGNTRQQSSFGIESFSRQPTERSRHLEIEPNRLDSRPGQVIPRPEKPSSMFIPNPKAQKFLLKKRKPCKTPEVPIAKPLAAPSVDPTALCEILAYQIPVQQEENFNLRPSIKITIPDHLKNILVDDWENVSKNLLLIPLPSKAPANFIIDTYYEEESQRRRVGSAEADILQEFCAGMKVYFDKSLGKILLYRFERKQLADFRKLSWESGTNVEWEGKGPGDAYGAEHLTRMLVNMPEMIAQTNMDNQSVSRLKEEISKFCQYLSRNSGRFFCAKYEKPDADYIEAAR